MGDTNDMLIEGSLWKLKSSLTGSTWKKHWVSADGDVLRQWHARNKPPATESPKYTFHLRDCTVEDNLVRKYCFKVTEKSTNTSLVFAADDFDTYEKWLKLLVYKHAPHDEMEEADVSIGDEDQAEYDRSVGTAEEMSVQQTLPTDTVLDFFKSHDVTDNAGNPCVPVRQLTELLRQLDASLNIGIVLRLIVRDFNTGYNGLLSYIDFVAWWATSTSLRFAAKQRAALNFSSNRIEPNTIVGIDSPESVHLVGFIDAFSLLDKKTIRSAFLAHLRLPPNDAVYDTIATPELDEVSDWNDVYQSSAERVAELSSHLLEHIAGPESDIHDAVAEEPSVQQASPRSQPSYIDPHYDDGESVLSEAKTENTHQISRADRSHHPSTPPSRRGTNLSVISSRNSVPYPDAVSRDGYIAPKPRDSLTINSHSQGLSGGQHGGSVSPSAVQSVHTKGTQQSPTASISPSSQSIQHSGFFSQSMRSGKSVTSQQSQQGHGQFSAHSPRSPHLPPLPEESVESVHSDETKSERSYATSQRSGLPTTHKSAALSEIDQWKEALDACVGLSATKGAFYRTAIDGVRCIIDEYCLPDEMKTATKLSADLVDTEGFHGVSENANSTAVEVYAHAGMLFSIAACPASTADAPQPAHSVVFADGTAAATKDVPTDGEVVTKATAAALQRLALVSASDEVQHKVAGNEIRNTGLLQATIDLLFAQAHLSQRIAASAPEAPHNSDRDRTSPSIQPSNNLSMLSSSAGYLNTDAENSSVAESYDSRMPPPLPPDSASGVNFLPPVRPTTLLTTVVDYAGFRVTVLCPTLIDEPTTLVHGPSSIPAPRVGDNANPTTIQIRAMPEVPLVLSQLARQLNLSSYHRPRSVCHQRLNEADNTEPLPVRNVELLSSDLQVHDAPDGRVYVLNLKNLLPNALPRAHSYDVQTRQLRPEYIQSVEAALKTDILQQSIAVSLDGTPPGVVDARSERIVLQESVGNLSACKDLFSNVLPAVAAMLDNFASIPLESFGLTQFLHSCGVNCRHMGVLYWLCNAPSVKQILLSEALARCCKTILNVQLRAHSRKTKGGVLRAQHRGRSIQHDYKEFVSNASQQHRATVLELFNLVLGWGPASDKFWSATLLDALNQKFGISATKAHVLSVVHLPQLFLAMQYHTGTRFEDSPIYNMNTTVVVNPFNTQHIAEYFVPTAKLQLSIPGEVGRVCALGESLLMNGLYAEAASAFKFKQLVQAALFAEPTAHSGDKVKSAPYVHQSAVAHVSYKVALSQYLAGQLVGAYRTVRKYLARCQHYHPITGRMLTLLMCVEYKLGKADKAVQYFDAAQEIYTYTLGPNHPMLCMHINCLGDLYQQSNAHHQGRAMKLLAHVTAQKALGDRHILTALLECRLAGTYVDQQEYATAMPLLETCVEVFTAAIVEGGNFEYEAALCLYNLSVCLTTVGDVDRAGQLALRCVEVARRVDFKKFNMYPTIASAYFLLGDLALLKNQVPAAIGLLEQCWALMHKLPASFAQRKWAGDVMAVLTRRILGLLVGSLNMATRSLFDSVVSEWHRQQASVEPPTPTRRSVYDPTSPLTNIDDDITVSTVAEADHSRAQVQAEAWEHTCAVVFKAMLQYSPVEYFDMTMQGIRERALSSEGAFAEDEQSIQSPSAGGLQPPSTTKVTFAAQAAVISKLVFQATEGASHNFINL